MNSIGNLTDFIDENWHGGQIEGDFFDHPEMQLEENLKVEKKQKKSIWNWQHAVTRELMRGKHKPEILNKYKVVIDRFGIYDAVNQFLEENDGVLGYFVVDVSNFDENFSYDDIPSQLKSCNLYAINATELREVINRSLVSESDGTLDGYLNSDDTIDEQVYYFDDYTGLPCIDDWNMNFDEDERLEKIASLFQGRQWMTSGEKQKFDNMTGKLQFLISLVKKSFALKSNSNDKYSDDIKDYNVENEELQADSIKSFKDAEVNNIHENKLDDIGHTAMPEKVELKEEYKKSDFEQDVDYNTFENYYDMNDNLHELNENDYNDDVEFELSEDFIIDDVQEMEEDEFEYQELTKGKVDLCEMFDDESDKNELEYEELSEDFIIEDVEDMKDDDFDYEKSYESDVDIDEMMDEVSDKSEINLEKKVDEIEISDKYDWGWE